MVLNYIKDCQSILEEVVSADRTKNKNFFKYPKLLYFKPESAQI
jgi:hypothetical protein